MLQFSHGITWKGEATTISRRALGAKCSGAAFITCAHCQIALPTFCSSLAGVACALHSHSRGLGATANVIGNSMKHGESGTENWRHVCSRLDQLQPCRQSVAARVCLAIGTLIDISSPGSRADVCTIVHTARTALRFFLVGCPHFRPSADSYRQCNPTIQQSDKVYSYFKYFPKGVFVFIFRTCHLVTT